MYYSTRENSIFMSIIKFDMKKIELYDKKKCS